MILKFILSFLWLWNCHTMMITHIQSADKTHVALLLFSFIWAFAWALFQQNPSKSQNIITVITLFLIDSRSVEIWYEVCACVRFQIIFVAIKTTVPRMNGMGEWWLDGWMIGGFIAVCLVWSFVLQCKKAYIEHSLQKLNTILKESASYLLPNGKKTKLYNK